MAIGFLGESGLAELFNDGGKEFWGDGEIVKTVAEGVVRFFRSEDLVLEALIRSRIAEVALHVVDTIDEPLPEHVVHGAKRVFANFLAELFAKGLGGHLIEREANDGEVLREEALFREVEQRREEFAFGEVAACTENHHDAGSRGMRRCRCENAVSHRSGPPRKVRENRFSGQISFRRARRTGNAWRKELFRQSRLHRAKRSADIEMQ